MGIKIVIPGASFPTSLPKLRNDPLLTDGSLLLLDFGRDYTLTAGAVPAHNGLLGNLAWEEAVALIGSGSEESMKASFLNTMDGEPTMGLVERSEKEGLHIIASQTNMDGADRAGIIRAPADVLQYAFDNIPSRSFYMSVWGRTTRMGSGGYQVLGQLSSAGAASTSYAFLYYGSDQYPNTGSAFVGGVSSPGTEVVGTWFRNVAVDEWTGTKPANTGLASFDFWMGQHGAWIGFQNNVGRSGVFYRMYLEDLTASGRSYAEVSAADQALFNEAFGTGGRFASDTFTSPATLP